MGKREIKIIKLLKEFKRKVNEKIRIDEMILFGSRAKGEEGKNSDVDLIIVSKDFEGKKYFKRAPLFYFMWDSPYDVDILCLTLKELNEKKKQAGIVQEAIREGIEI
ncbi:nucleotidyltransferase domain-containing protein [Candidatus Pacearchaeota archaeon]|nr:nucleotidyltransferase domain-containing protein [Candidatus Pacearchaeota archaeon]